MILMLTNSEYIDTPKVCSHGKTTATAIDGSNLWHCSPWGVHLVWQQQRLNRRMGYNKAVLIVLSYL